MSDQWEVYCSYGSHYVPESDAIQTGERIGPDLMEEPVYICFDCAEEMDVLENEIVEGM